MSRHQILPPIVFVPQPKPKKIETRKSRIQMRASGAVEDTGEVEETYEPIEPGGSTLTGNIPPENFLPIEGSEHKPPSTLGRLSESTLKVMLLAQEMS
jgi:hypothetical protein